MRIDSLENNIAQTATATYTSRLEINHPTTESSGPDSAQGGGGDKVSLSEEGLRRSQEDGSGKLDKTTEIYKKLVAEIKEKIKRVEQEIEDIEGSDMPPEQKKQMLELKQKELAMYQAELVAAIQKKLDELKS